MDDKKILEIYENKALKHGSFHAVLDASDNEFSKRGNLWFDFALKKYMAKFLKPHANDFILDFGTGVGRLSNFFSPKVNKIVGVYVSTKMLEIAKEKRVFNIQYVLFSEFVKREDWHQKFDKIISCWVLASISDKLLIENLKTLQIFLKPNGKFIMLEQTVQQDLLEGDSHIKRSIDSYKKIFEQFGFEIEHVEHVIRMPAYTMNFWKKNSWLPNNSLPFLIFIESLLIERKPQFADYYTTAFVFRKK